MIEERKLLAKAMGWKFVSGVPGSDGLGPKSNPYWTLPMPGIAKIHCPRRVSPPDPFTDAVDDYRVLAWLRTRRYTENQHDAAALKPLQKSLWCYQVGDFARAALEILKGACDQTGET